MNKKIKRVLLSLAVAGGILAACIVFALTDMMDPVIQSIHTNSITPLGGLLCALIALIGFYGVYTLLVHLGDSLLPDARDKSSID